MKKKLKPKKAGYGLEVRTFEGDSGRSYMVFRTPNGSFHVFAEIEAKQAARDCGVRSGNTRQRWEQLWRSDGEK